MTQSSRALRLRARHACAEAACAANAAGSVPFWCDSSSRHNVMAGERECERRRRKPVGSGLSLGIGRLVGAAARCMGELGRAYRAPGRSGESSALLAARVTRRGRGCARLKRNLHRRQPMLRRCFLGAGRAGRARAREHPSLRRALIRGRGSSLSRSSCSSPAPGAFARIQHARRSPAGLTLGVARWRRVCFDASFGDGR